MNRQFQNRLSKLERKSKGGGGLDGPTNIFFATGAIVDDAEAFLWGCGHQITETDVVVKFIGAAEGVEKPLPLADLNPR